MPSNEWSALRDTYVACAPTTIAGLLATNPGIDLAGIDGLHRLAAEPTEVRYAETEAAGLASLWAEPVHGDPDRVLVYFHGGGFVSGSKESHRKIAGHLAKAAGCRALVPDYRLAPAHPYPAQLDDARALYAWLLAAGHRPGSIALAGESAGGNIATATALALVRQGLTPPAAIVAFSPWYDLEGEGETYESKADTDLAISRRLVHVYGSIYLGGSPATDPLANPLYSDPAGLPPVFLTVGSEETLLDSVEAFAGLARRAGVEAVLRIGEGMQHGYQLMAGRLPEADASIAEAGRWLRERFDD